MGLYLYGVTVATTELPDVLGLDDRPVRLVGDGTVSLVVGELIHAVAELESDPERAVAAVRRHDDVLAELARASTVVPVRFGTVLADEPAAERLLAERGAMLRDALDAVADADEWVVAVAVGPHDPDDEDGEEDLSPGHAFFARKRTEREARSVVRARAGEAAQELAGRLVELARDSRQLPVREPDTVDRNAYLVDRDRRAAFLAATSDMPATVTVQGPLPPYRFAPEMSEPLPPSPSGSDRGADDLRNPMPEMSDPGEGSS